MYGKKLKQIRTKWKLTQDKMSKILNVSTRTYTSYEREENNPPYSMLINLCKEHGINLNWFIADIGDMFNESAVPNEQLENLVAQIVDKKMKERGL